MDRIGLAWRLARRASVLVLCALAAGCASVEAPAHPPVFAGAPDGVADRVVVIAVANPRGELVTQAGTTPGLYAATPRYVAGIAAQQLLDEVARDHGLQRLSAWPIPSLDVYCATFLIRADRSREAVLASLAQDARIRIAQPLNEFETMGRESPASAPTPTPAESPPTYNDPYLPLQHTLVALDVLAAHHCGRGAGVTIAIVDTGVDTTHADLRGARMTTANAVDDDETQYRRDFHGTAVAGLIAATPDNGLGIAGIAPDAKLLLFKACWQKAEGPGATCNSFTLAQGLSTAIDRGVQVINLSLGGPPDDLLTRLVRKALAKGIVVVGAVPPDDDRHGFPVGVPGVIAVREGVARDASDTALSLPGRDVLSLTPGSRFDFVSGSSFSTADVSAISALLLQHDAHLDGTAIARVLRASISGNAGLPDVLRAVSAVDASCQGVASR